VSVVRRPSSVVRIQKRRSFTLRGVNFHSAENPNGAP